MKKILLSLFATGAILIFSSTITVAQVVIKVKPKKPAISAAKPSKPAPAHIWIDGHWHWSNRCNKYIWKEGCWKKPTKGKTWAKGHWDEAPGGHKWVPGHWKKEPMLHHKPKHPRKP